MFFFFKWVRISPEIDWYHYQGASPASNNDKDPYEVKCHVRAQCGGGGGLTKNDETGKCLVGKVGAYSINKNEMIQIMIKLTKFFLNPGLNLSQKNHMNRESFLS